MKLLAKKKIYNFWKLRFFYDRTKFLSATYHNKSYYTKFFKAYTGWARPNCLLWKKTFNGSNSVKPWPLNQAFFFICWYSAYCSFIETQLIYCVFGFLLLLSENSSIIAEAVLPSIYLFFHFVLLVFSDFFFYLSNILRPLSSEIIFIFLNAFKKIKRTFLLFDKLWQCLVFLSKKKELIHRFLSNGFFIFPGTLNFLTSGGHYRTKSINFKQKRRRRQRL